MKTREPGGLIERVRLIYAPGDEVELQHSAAAFDGA